MANGFPGFAVVRSGARAVTGLSSVTASEVALLSAERAAFFALRFSSAFMAAALIEWAVTELIRQAREPVINTGSWALQCQRNPGVCTWSSGVWYYGSGTCSGTSASSDPGLPPVVPGVDWPDATRILKWAQITGGGLGCGSITGLYGQYTVMKRTAAGAPLVPGAPALFGNAGVAPAPTRTTKDDGYAPPIGGTGAVPGVVPFPGVMPIPGWPGVYPEGVTGAVSVPVPIAPGVVIPVPGSGAVPVPGTVVDVPVIPGIGTVVEQTPGSGIETSPMVRAAAPSRPQFPLKEMKARVNAALGGFKMFYNGATEAGDFVDALHDALPRCWQATTAKAQAQARAVRKYGWNKKYRKSEASPAAKLQAVTAFLNELYYRPDMLASDVCKGSPRPVSGKSTIASKWASQVDGVKGAREQFVNQALQNLVKENFKDFVYGNIGRRIGEVSRDTGLPVGLQTIKSAAQFSL